MRVVSVIVYVVFRFVRDCKCLGFLFLCYRILSDKSVYYYENVWLGVFVWLYVMV